MSDNGTKKRVLHITMRWGEGRGGVKQFILNAVSSLDPDRYEQSVLSVGPITGDDLGLDLHGPVVNRGGSLSLLLAAPRLEQAIRSSAPDVVHIHCNNGLGLLYAAVARRAGCVVRVCHSHNTAVEAGCVVKRATSFMLKRRFASAPTQRVACSDLAGAYLYGSHEFTVVRNGIDVARFVFDPNARRDIRAQYGIDDRAMVLGNVGSGIPVKNAGFIIDLVRVLVDSGKDVHALLVGSGEEIAVLHNRAIDGRVSDRVHFVGTVGDAWRYYSAMDAFLLPSLYEGLPISLIEAQANGLPCVASDAVSAESNVVGLVDFLPLSSPLKEWVLKVSKAAIRGASRCAEDSLNAQHVLSQAGFSLEALRVQLKTLYSS